MPEAGTSAAYRGLKRGMDVAAAALALVACLPLLLAAAAAIRIDSPGPVLFRQVRVGRNNRFFACLKLRSMVVDASALGSWRTSDRDSRITRVGRWLRRTSIDELPQLWNVLAGDMSLVGPRPMVPQQMSDWTPADLAMRHRLRPGLTGLAQVSGRSALAADRSDQLDLEYCRHACLALDLRILGRTVAVVAAGVGTN